MKNFWNMNSKEVEEWMEKTRKEREELTIKNEIDTKIIEDADKMMEEAKKQKKDALDRIAGRMWGFVNKERLHEVE